ncbi:MAG: phosphoglycerate kinase [Bacteroidetes bacterium]|jgi:phosphoglycerate kinase|nr:phosphoglycerate kinase [Bacteroidota bacterium]MBT5529308.1 phosphoglycerate kinase [Cytophagia bacterium]MBT3422780.1 phosphoglycerate kinase [Bacteroidota bacterium]MBT3801267.1 phosphoglycerate kinase [Bacteroidota bacterium]MBT4338016.1 phosphoglycerate kinase [Bacteroidota bacterium]
MKTVDNFNFKNKKALVRVDYNVPLNDAFEITDDSRIKASLPTLNKILADGGSLILMSHMGRPKGEKVERYSLKHIVDHLSKALNTNVKFADDCIGETTNELSTNLLAGEVLLLENLRYYKEEEKGDESFAKKLAEMGEIYVNDAFGTAHRAHASTTIVANYFPDNKCFGYLMKSEIENINKVLKESVKPLTAIIGGAKVSDKVLIIEQLLEKVDNLIIGGGMAYTFFRAMGGKTGDSLVEEDRIELASKLLNKAALKEVKIYLPIDSHIADSFSNEAKRRICNSDKIHTGWMGLDIGKTAIETYTNVIQNSKTILWNGPMGVFEFSNFQQGTKAIAEAVAEATKNGAFSLIGGGDSVAAINKFELHDQVSYISTGGGAMLEYLEGKELPGIKAILD